MKTMILAAGLGTRMRPLTDHLPKPLVEAGGKTLIDHALDFFTARGVQEKVVNASYKAEMLEAHLKDAGVRISREDAPLETGGGIAKALPLLGDAPFFVLNSDVIVIDPPGDLLRRMQAGWDAQADALLLLHPREKALGYDGPGDFFLEGERLRRRGEAAGAPYVFAGLQLLHPRLFEGAPHGAFSMNVLYNRGMAADGTLAPGIRALVHEGDWLHVGDPAGLAAADAYFTAR